MMTRVAVTGSFDDLRFPQVRFLQEAARFGEVHVLLWSDSVVQAMEGHPPKFPLEERLYFIQALRYVHRVTVIEGAIDRDTLPQVRGFEPNLWAFDLAQDSLAKQRFGQAHHLTCKTIPVEQLKDFPPASTQITPPSPGRKKVLVTGCYDWLHTGHVRFFEEVSEYGDLYVVLGHDANLQLLKGPGHPQFPQDLRHYMVHSIRYVRQALISTGSGYLDAEPEIQRIKPDIYAVNEDGDKPEKKAYCQQHGIEYLVLKRLPKPGLPRRQSTALRGF